MNKNTWVLGALLAAVLTGCPGGNRVVVVEDNPAVNQIRSTARAASISSGSLYVAITTAISAHSVAVTERNNSLLSGDSSLAVRAESVAATSIRAVGVTIDSTAARVDALSGAGADTPRQYQDVLAYPLSVVTSFANSIAEKNDQLTTHLETFSVAAQDVHEQTANVQVAVNEVNASVDAFAAADSISVARNALDAALAEVVMADVLLTETLNDIRLDAELLQSAIADIERFLPVAPSPQREIE